MPWAIFKNVEKQSQTIEFLFTTQTLVTNPSNIRTENVKWKALKLPQGKETESFPK